jgi:hypothetical protein
VAQIVRVCEIAKLGVAMDVFRGIQDNAHRLVRMTPSDKAFHMLPYTNFSVDPLQHAPGLGRMEDFAACVLSGEKF